MSPVTRSQKRKLEQMSDRDKDEKHENKKIVKKQKEEKEEIKDKWKVLNYLRPYKFPTDVFKPEYYEWVSASSIKNYMLKDSLIDWLDLYYNKYGYNDTQNLKKNENIKTKTEENKKTEKKEEITEQTKILFSLGNEFEKLIFEELDKKFPNETVFICTKRVDFFNRGLIEKTKEELKKGTPIIKQAMLVNEENKTYGVADLLVRSDYINKIFTESFKYEAEQEPAKNLGKQIDYHYVVIDIKYSNINLCANGETILNSGRTPAYKGQMTIYNLALGLLQGYIPEKAFILGKSWKSTSESNSNYDSFNRLGVIDYEDFDLQYIESTTEAVSWIRDVRLYGHEWSILNPHRVELYPNMCTTGSEWDKVKENIAEEVSELTQIWMVGYKNREYAHENNIYNWKDEKCTSQSMNIHGKVIAPIVDKILEVNRSNQIISPEKIKNNIYNWQEETELDFYIDFETMNDIFLNTKNINIHNTKSISDICFRICVGYMENGQYQSKSFLLKENKPSEEKRIYAQLKNLIEKKTREYNKKTRQRKKARLFHWSHAEQTFLNHASIRHNRFLDKWLKSVIFIDMCKVFMQEPIVIKGMMKFKLKDVAKAMYNNGMIQTNWGTNEINNGLSAMLGAVKYYKDKKESNIMKNISKYNEVDVKVLYEIVSYLRNNNI